jgi:hypothetical protein
MKLRILSRILAALLLVGLLFNWRLVAWVFRVRDVLGIVVGVTWLVLTLAGVIGLARARRWGAYSLLVLAPLSTVMLATPLLPGIDLVGGRGPVALVAWNAIALVGAVLVLRTREHPDHGAQAA